MIASKLVTISAFLAVPGLTLNVFDTEPLREKLTVHMVHHTHDDVGWLKTVDEYYSGTDNNIQRVQVELILDSVMEELIADDRKRFSYVEMKFFSMWWETQTEEMKRDVRKLVREGRLELLNAGWSMQDEACVYYEDMLNNMMVGHEFVKQEFGVTPRIGWHIDPFGHSNANQRLFAEMGFDAFFIARLDYQDKAKRLEEKTMEFVWRPMFDTLGERAQIFTHCLYHHYSAPPGFDFDTLSGDDPFITDKRLTTYNADKKALEFHNWIMEQRKYYRSNNLIITMGDDFRFQNAKQYFKSSAAMIDFYNEHIGKHSNIELVFSTPSMYIDAVFAEGLTWPTKYDDMFPYADNDQSYWTGFYSSRANSKEYIRRAEHTLMASNKLFALNSLNQEVCQSDFPERAKEAKHGMMDVVGVTQHHDAATGTGRQHVADDYDRLIFNQIQAANPVYAEAFDFWARKTGFVADEWQWCFRTNSTFEDCPVSGHQSDTDFKMLVAVHNPSNLLMQTAKIAVPHGKLSVKVFDSEKKEMVKAQADALCYEQPEELNPAQTVNNCQLYVKYPIEAQSLGFIAVEFDQDSDLAAEVSEYGHMMIQSDELQLTFEGPADQDEGVYFKLLDKKTGQTKTLGFDMRYWQSYQNDNAQSSGVYIFKPAKRHYDSYPYGTLSSISVSRGNVKSQFVLLFKGSEEDSTGETLVRISIEELPVLRFDVELYGIPFNPDIGHEVTVNFLAPKIQNGGVFYTDSNGLAMQRRELNFRPTWDLDLTGKQNITANYYPIGSAIAIRDTRDQWQMTVMNTRSQGGSVIKDGRIELMQNRRINNDDWRGMGEPLNETDAGGNGITVPATYFVQLFDRSQRRSLQRVAQQMQDNPAQYFFSFNPSEDQISHVPTMVAGELGKVLKKVGFTDEMKLELYTLGPNQLLMRIENIADTFDSPLAYQLVDVERLARQLFTIANDGQTPIDVRIEEGAITANQSYHKMAAKRLKWQTVDDIDLPQEAQEELTRMRFQQQRIRTFKVQYTVQEGLLK